MKVTAGQILAFTIVGYSLMMLGCIILEQIRAQKLNLAEVAAYMISQACCIHCLSEVVGAR